MMNNRSYSKHILSTAASYVPRAAKMQYPLFCLALLGALGCSGSTNNSSNIIKPPPLPALSPLPTPPSTATFYPQLENVTSNPGTWQLCTGTNCSGGTNTGSGTQSFGVTSPEYNGLPSMSQTSNGNGYNVLGYNHLACSVGPASGGTSTPPAGGTSTTGTLTLTVSTPTITSTSITISASASDSKNTVTAIQIYLGGNLVFNSATTAPITPITYTANGLTGSPALAVKAWNSVGTSTLFVFNMSTVSFGVAGPECATISNVLDDLYFYIPESTNQLQALEFDPDLYSGGYEYFISMQCDSVSGNWRFWDMASNNWTALNASGGPIPVYPCVVLTQTGAWHHLQLYGTIDQQNQTYAYETFVLDGVTVYKNLGNTYPAKPSSQPSEINIEQQIDNNSSATANTVYYDDYNFWVW